MGQEAGNYSVLKAPGAALQRPKHVHKRRGSALGPLLLQRGITGIHVRFEACVATSATSVIVERFGVTHYFCDGRMVRTRFRRNRKESSVEETHTL